MRCTVLCAGLAAGLAGQVAAALELKLENHDKDDIHSSDDLKSDDEGDKRDIKTPRGGTRTRYSIGANARLCFISVVLVLKV